MKTQWENIGWEMGETREWCPVTGRIRIANRLTGKYRYLIPQNERERRKLKEGKE